ncbi:hypothetical protein KBC59_04325 [Patescibacteria group bacterium]|nr:hypothetical protein [Patescibacteria group bacterium]
MSGISRGVADQLIQALAPKRQEAVPEGARINVHAAVSRFSVLYERIRNAVDYKDEHLLRKSAILRILKRQLILERDPQVIAWNLVRELIGARYLPNGELSESVVDAVAIRVKKYQIVSRCRSGSSSHDAWLLAVIAVELEELLVDSTSEKALVTFLYERTADRIQVTGKAVEQTDARLQTYIAGYRGYLKADDEVLSYKLLRAYMPEWLRPDEWMSQPQPVADRLIGVERRIKRTLTHPLAPKFLRAMKPWAVALTILRDALLEKPGQAGELLSNSEALRKEITSVSEKRYADAAGRLRRGAIRATIYLFFTKMVFALAVEVPIELFWLKHIAYGALATNLLFPPVLMFLIGLLIKVPGKDNTLKMIENVELLLGGAPLPMREIRLPRERGFLSKTIFSSVYAFMFMVIFGALVMFLTALEFTWVSIGIFVFFLCLVSFFGFRLRSTAREFVVVEPKHGLMAVLGDFLSLPILRAGKFLSRGISRLNVFLFFFDFLFEAPFKMFLTVLEEWFGFLKEKKEELQ